MLLANSISATTYFLKTGDAKQNQRIVVQDILGVNKVTCTLPEILNEIDNICEVPIPTCTFPNVLNESNDDCINTFDKVGWIDRTDSCKGVRSVRHDGTMLVLRANTNYKISNPPIPEGYRWATIYEFQSLGQRDVGGLNYHNMCGNNGYPNINGLPQYEITLSDTGTSNARSHAGTHINHVSTSWRYDNNWLGIVVIRDN